MKKTNVSPLELDKETIANLDEKELQQIAGGNDDQAIADEECKRESCMERTDTCGVTVKTKAE